MMPYLIAIFCFLVSFLTTTQGATWNTNTNNQLWGTNANWTSPATAPNGVGAQAIFGNIITGNRNVLLNNNFTVGDITFNDNNNYTLFSNNSSVRTLTFDVASGNATINVTGAGGNHTIGSSGTIEVVLNDNLVVNHNTTGTFTLAAGMTGTGSFTKNGTGYMIYYKPPQSTTGYYTGNTIINAGTLQLGIVDDANVEIGGSPQIIINGGTLLYGGSNQIHDAAVMVMNGGTWNLNGYDETLASLTVSASSTIDLGFCGDSIVSFNGGVSYTSGSTLTIKNWDGFMGIGGGPDRIIFGTSVSSAFLSNVFWQNQNIMGALQLASGEIIPIPEASTVCMAIGMSSIALMHYIRRRKLESVITR